MKTFLKLVAGGLFLSGVVMANTVAFDCGGAASSAGSATLSAAITCSSQVGFTVPLGWSINDMILIYDDGYQLGNSPGVNSFTFTWTGTPTAFTGTNPQAETASGGVNPSSFLAQCNTSPDAVAEGAGAWQAGGCSGQVTAGFATYLASFSAGTVNSSTNSGSLSAVGTLGVDAFLYIDYSPTGITPEPMSLMLVGSGLLGLGLAASKLRKKA